MSETLHTVVRRETWGEEFGQSGWITAPEQDGFIQLLGLKPGQALLDIGCGSGGPLLRFVQRTGITAHGIDVQKDGIATARRQAEERKLIDRATFEVCDATGSLPFGDDSFDAVMSVDAISHMPNRAKVLTEWGRVIKTGGKLLFTNASVLTGEATHEELSIRGAFGLQVYVAPGIDERAIESAGLNVIVKEDTTDQVANVARRWHEARGKREAELREVEGNDAFERLQRFLAVASQLAHERRLCRYTYVAGK
ncbi:MAG: class I SAM-dependent methyltransferase [Woeseiaceae bacterium]